jgi:integrase
VLCLTLETGLRIGDAAAAEIAGLHESERELRLQTKTGERTVALGPGALDLLVQQRARVGSWSPYFFPSPRDPSRHVEHHGVWQTHNVAHIEAGVPRRRIQDQRHTWVTSGLRLGFSLADVGHSVKHQSEATTRIYAHVVTLPVEHEVAGAIYDARQRFRQDGKFVRAEEVRS